MNFGIRNELHAYNSHRRAERMDALIAKVCIVGLIVYIILEVLWEMH